MSASLKELLFTEMLAMDVYHRDVKGGLFELVGTLPQIDGVQPGTTRENQDIGFFAKSYTKGGTTYIVYRGTDDGSLDVGNNTLGILSGTAGAALGASP